MFRNNLEFTKFLYQNLSWGPLYKKNDGKIISNLDNNSEKYIKETLRKFKLSPAKIKKKTVFNIGTGREARVFAKYGAIVTHIDLGKETVNELRKWSKKNKKKVESYVGDINTFELEKNKFDFIFLAGIYQHLENPASCLIKLMNSLKKDGLMYLGFYRTGEFKYFIVDAIRYIITKKLFTKIRNINSIIYCFSEFNHYQSSRVMDDFYVPFKHNFHPRDVINDLKLLGGKIHYFDNDFRKYNHESKKYFTIGGDRVYVKKTIDKVFDKKNILKKLKTSIGHNQLLDIKYKEKIINKNIKLIKLIKSKYKKKLFDDENIVCLVISMYQLTRPYNLDNSDYYLEGIKNGRHKVLNLILENFIKNFDTSNKKNINFKRKLKNLFK